MRKIIHADMDAFYASVEIRENPSLRGKPIVVGGSPESRGVVCAASYEARKYGVRSAIPCSMAKRLCPSAIFIYPNFSLYKEASIQIHEIFSEFTDLIEPLSLDEAYLDVTENKISEPFATEIAKAIKIRVKKETELTISCGVSYNKFLAKIASDWKKPDGLFVIRPEQAEEFLDELPIGKFHGIGKVTEKKMIHLGIKNGKDLKKMNLWELEKYFGKTGKFYYNIVRGIDNREVNSYRERKSLGIEDTFSIDSQDADFLEKELNKLASGLFLRMEKNEIRGRTLTVKLKYSDFTVKTISRTFSHWIENEDEISEISCELFYSGWEADKSIRLLGISIGNLEREEEAENQPMLFATD
ncbi:MAG: DNA polymerase IV [Leptospira sp.]|nr:DNA polymerase IV [Leptospira sp.]